MSLFQFIIESIYHWALKVVHVPGLALLVLSASVTLILLPIYGVIRLIETRLAPRRAKFQALEDELRRVYEGQTLQMYLRTLYRQQNYPAWVSGLPVLIPLLQLPFFFAAFQVLSKEPTLSGSGLWAIADLARPDGLIQLGSLTLNLLPLLMTFLNFSAIEQTGKASQTQRFMALGFFALLYSMPAGLLVYWSSNNFWQWVIAFIKNPSIHWLKDRTSELGSLARDVVRQNQQKLSRSQLLGLILTSLLPVMHYTYSNIAFLNNYYLLEIFLKLFVPSSIAIYFLNRISQFFIKSPMLGVLASAFIFSFFLTPLWLHIHQARIEDAQWHLYLLYILTSVIFIWATLRARVFFVIGLVLFVVTFGRFTARYVNRYIDFAKEHQLEARPDFLNIKASRKPNIYFLVYDAYIPQRVSDYFGVDNRDQFEFLRKNNFTIYEDKLSMRNSSLDSDSLLLNLGFKINNARRVLVGHSFFDEWLRDNDYERIYYANDYFFYQEKEISVSKLEVPNKRDNVLLKGILEGEFKFDLIAKSYTDKQWIDKKRILLAKKSNKPFFFFAHSKRPGHTQNSGKCLPNEPELFKERLKLANKEMEEDISQIIQNDPGAIVITAGDHGVYFTGDCFKLSSYSADEITAENLIDQFNVHLAIKWPNDADVEKLDFFHLQGSLVSVMGYMTNNFEILKYEKKIPICLKKTTCFHPDGFVRGGVDDGKELFHIFEN